MGGRVLCPSPSAGSCAWACHIHVLCREGDGRVYVLCVCVVCMWYTCSVLVGWLVGPGRTANEEARIPPHREAPSSWCSAQESCICFHAFLFRKEEEGGPQLGHEGGLWKQQQPASFSLSPTGNTQQEESTTKTTTPLPPFCPCVCLSTQRGCARRLISFGLLLLTYITWRTEVPARRSTTNARPLPPPHPLELPRTKPRPTGTDKGIRKMVALVRRPAAGGCPSSTHRTAAAAFSPCCVV